MAIVETGNQLPLGGGSSYQEIDYWIGNVLQDNPDKNPPVEIDNKHKIISNGFDLKTSFRHPIK